MKIGWFFNLGPHPIVQVSGEKTCFSKNEKGNDILNTMRFDMNVIILLEDEKL